MQAFLETRLSRVFSLDANLKARVLQMLEDVFLTKAVIVRDNSIDESLNFKPFQPIGRLN